MAGSHTVTTAALALKSMWDDRFTRRPNENRNITKRFMKGDRIGDTSYFRITPTITASSGDGTSGLSLTYDNTATERVSITPTSAYSAIRPTVQLVKRFTEPDAAKQLAAWRNQGMAGVWTSIESTAAQLATGISTQLGAPTNITEALFLQGKAILRGQAKEYADMEQGSPGMYFVYDTSQIQYVESIPAIMHANIRGDKANPTTNGLVQQDGWGFTFSTSAHIYKNAGIAYNMLMAGDKAFVIGFNAEPYWLDPQPEELTVRYICFADSGSTELLDECCVVFRTPV